MVSMRSSAPVKKEEKHGYEFGGPYVPPPFTSLTHLSRPRIGAFGVSFGLPILTYIMTFLCNDIAGCPVPSALTPSTLTLEALKEETGWPGISGLASWKVTGWVLAYYFLSLVLHRILPGEVVEGVELSSGGRLKYKFNSTRTFSLLPSIYPVYAPNLRTTN
jgi:delta14-sterol reductase